MKILLKIKSWQIFTITWIIPFIIGLLEFIDPYLLIKLNLVKFPFFMIGTFFWIWSIAVILHPALAKGVYLNLRRFKILFSIIILYEVFSTIYSLLMMNGFIEPLSPESESVSILIQMPINLIVALIILWEVNFAAKTLKSVEIKREAKLNEYIGDFFLMILSFIGYWVIQPRLNKIMEEK